MQNFHNLRVWNEANSLAIAVKRLTTRFSKADHGSLRNQMGRSAESIADNIAEGCGAATNAEFARYLDMAIKSSSELESQIERSHGYALIRSHERESLATQVCNVRKMTWGLRIKVLTLESRSRRDPVLPPRPDHERRTDHGQRIPDDGGESARRRTKDG